MALNYLLDHTGSTPLIEAVRHGHVDVVNALLERGNIIYTRHLQ